MPPCGEVDLFSARDAIEACNGLEGEEAEACFLVFGLDCSQTRKNFATVAKLEAALDIPYDEATDPDDMHDDKANFWNLPQPFNEIAAMWSDAFDDVKRFHDASAHS
jgi:hypothetical protein